MQPTAGFLVLWTEQQFGEGENVARIQFFPTREDAEAFARSRLSDDSFHPTSHVFSTPGVFVVEATFHSRTGPA